MKKTKPKNIGIEEGEESQFKGSENIFNKIIEEKIPNCGSLNVIDPLIP